MKAITYTQYGSPDVLELKEMKTPAFNNNEIRVKVSASSVNYGDLIARNFKNISPAKFNMPFIFWLIARLDFGLRKPRRQILGSEFSGEVDAVGSHVARFKKGDQVFGFLGQHMGAYARYVSMPEDGTVALKPANMTHQEAAVIPMGSIFALNLLKKANIQPGQNVLINGASGSIGSAAVQLAKYHFGAKVTGVCGALRLEFVKNLGADRVIDYTKEDFTILGQRYDLIFDVLGKSSFSKCKAALTPGGCYLLASFKMRQLFQMLLAKLGGDKKVICALASENSKDLVLIKELVEAGKIKAIIDRQFSVDQAAKAHAYVENGQKKGHVAINFENTNA